jgi:RHS repeat-associated protein
MFGLHGLSNPSHDPNLGTNGGMLYYQYDGKRSVSEVTDRHGDIIERYRYDAFGGIFTGTTSPYNFNGFTGMRYDGKTGLVDMNARLYDPTVGRFMTEDTYPGELNQTQSLNRYSYVMNNPVNNWDPTGHVTESMSSLPSWVLASENYTNPPNGPIESGMILEKWYFNSLEKTNHQVQEIDSVQSAKFYTITKQQVVTNKWYYDYKRYLVDEDDIGKLTRESQETFQADLTYTWKDIIEAEDIAKENQEKIAGIAGPPPNASFTVKNVSLPFNYSSHVKKQTDNHLRTNNPKTLNSRNISSGIGRGAASFVADIIPGIGTAKAFQQAVTGIDLVTGRKLSTVDRVAEGFGGLMSLVPVPGAKVAGTIAAKTAITAIGALASKKVMVAATAGFWKITDDIVKNVDKVPKPKIKTPTVVDDVGAKGTGYTNEQLVQEIATRAEKKIGGIGSVAGTKKHTYAKDLLDRYQSIFGDRGLKTETSWLNNQQVPYGTKGSARLDVLDINTGDVFDYKFTIRPGKGLSQRQTNKILNQGPLNITNIKEVNP